MAKQENLVERSQVMRMLYSHENLIELGYGAFKKEYLLVHVSESTEIAGAGTRHVKECWRVVYKFDNCRHSRAYKTQEEAKTEFDRLTKPILNQE